MPTPPQLCLNNCQTYEHNESFCRHPLRVVVCEIRGEKPNLWYRPPANVLFGSMPIHYARLGAVRFTQASG